MAEQSQLNHESKFKSFLTHWLPLVLSVLALALSGYTLWVDKFDPFTLSVTPTNRAELWVNPQRPGQQLSLVLKMAFTNKGARVGVVQDLGVALVNLKNPSNKILLSPVYEGKDDPLNM